MPDTERVPLVQQEHITLLHVAHSRVFHMPMQRYWWPDMNDLCKRVCRAYRQCKRAKVRRRHLSATFSPLKMSIVPNCCLGRNMASTSTDTTMETSWSPLIYALEKSNSGSF